jgi:hypothetical protein
MSERPAAGGEATRAEVSRIRERIRASARRLDEHRDESRQEPGSPLRDPLAEADARLADRVAERPELGVLILILWPAWALYRLWRRGQREQRHEDFAFRYHDFVARNPEVGLLLTLGLAGVSVGVVFGVLLAAFWMVRAFQPYLPF